MEGLTTLSVGGFDLQQLEQFNTTLKRNAHCLADPAAAAEWQRELRQARLNLEARLPTATATVTIRSQTRPELNGAAVTIRRFLTDNERYTVQLPPTANGALQQISLTPANLVLAEGSAVVATGLTGAPELNGRRGTIEGWDEETGRYAVRLEGERRRKRLRPENCRADVLAL